MFTFFKMCECIDILGGPLEPTFGIGISKDYEVIGIFQNLFNHSWRDDIIYQSRHQVQPPCAEHGVCEDEVLILKTLTS